MMELGPRTKDHGLRTQNHELRTPNTGPRTKDMKRIVNKAKNFREAERWDILQQITMTAEERQRAAQELRKRVYGTDSSRADVSAGQRMKKSIHSRRNHKKK